MAKTPLTVPDIGGDAAEVVEILVAPGDVIDVEQSLVVLESDKASMEVPASHAGQVLELKVAVGDSVSQGDVLLIAETSSEETAPANASAGDAASEAPKASAPTTSDADDSAGDAAPEITPASPSKASPAAPATSDSASAVTPSSSSKSPVDAVPPASDADVYAGPAVRKLAREFGVDLLRVTGSGPKGRVIKEDLHRFVSEALSGQGASAPGAGIPAIPEVDFGKFGDVDPQPRSRLDKLTASNMHRNWLNLPQVTQFDDADITDLEAFRQSLKPEAERRGTKLTPLPFILKACAVALAANPKLKASLADAGETLVHKHYTHIGMAVDTPAGLVVPVVRDADRKSVWELAAEVSELAGLARDKKLRPDQMQGGVFSISSLGGIGGRGFTPIVNAPEVAILGVSRASIQPVWDGAAFQPRTLLPLSLSYDHRVINGGDAGRFLTLLVELLSDIRRLAL